MGRGKIEIKKIENDTNRQVTYSKRRAGILKKAQELTVLCDAKVALLMFSANEKISDYVSPGTSLKEVYNKYQDSTKVALWDSEYKRLQELLKKNKETNDRLRKEIRQRQGDELDGLSFTELRGLEQDMKSSVDKVRHRKDHVIRTQTDTTNKKIKSHEETQRSLLSAYDEMSKSGPQYAFVQQDEDYDPINIGSRIYAIQMQPHQDGDDYRSYGLRLA
uniref:MADS transcription factor AP3-2 n=1 Tax=Trautvetteria caroliniensis TaxID=46993 RepID=A0A7L7T4C4_9MAGN|nr:MADS transcription factor AP3-2 [Trautvetteria caroliniensis]